MAATYRLLVSTVNCYNSIIIDQRFQHTVHYCNGSCQAFPSAAGIDCNVVHHAVCSELLSHSSLPSSSPKFAGTQDMAHKFLTAESLATSADAADDSHQLLPGATRVKKGMGVQGLSSLKDITSDAINLASGKIKEFSFDKVKCPAGHVTFRKGRKVKPDMASRKSADFDITFNHVGGNENCPPFGLAQKTAIEQKEANFITFHEQSISNATQLYLQNLTEDNLIANFLGKHKADSSDSGEDIRICLDILLKCSEDLKRCTDIIKQCIKSKSHNNDDSDSSINPDLIYRNVMARLSSYLKKLPFELEHGLSGRGNQHDLAELVHSLHSLQQMPHPPFGNDQPPRYEDVVQSSPSPSTNLPPADTQIIDRATNGDGLIPIENVYGPSYNGHLQENGIQQNGSTAINQPHVLPHVNCSDSFSSQGSFLSRRIDSTSKIPMEPLYIQEDCDVDKILESRGTDYLNFGTADKNFQPQKQASPVGTCKRSGDDGFGIRANMGENRSCVQPTSESPSFSNNVSKNHNSAEPSLTRSKTKTESEKAHQQEEIEKLLMDLESFSQTINTRQEYDSSRNNDTDLKNHSQRPGQVNVLTTESGSKRLEVSLGETVPLSSPTKGTNVNKNNKTEEDDAALLLRILESIEGFAQELVERGSSKGILAREKEVMRILQDTLSQASESCKTAHSAQLVATKDTGSHLSVQQTPEVIKGNDSAQRRCSSKRHHS